MTSNRLSRREALKRGCALAAGAAAAPYAITSTALGQGDTPPASDRVTVGHIGVGGRGRALFGATRQVAQAQSVAVADCYRNKRESIASVCQGKAYQDFRDLLARDDIDAVIVATADHWHVPICLLAARAGKHVYVEKPLGLTIEQNLACQKEFQKTGRVFQYGTQQRSLAHCFQGCELVRRGAIGKITAIEVDAPNGGKGGSTKEEPVPEGLDYEMWLGPAPLVPYTADRCKAPGTYWIYDQSIGYLAGWGAHPLDIMVWGSDADISGPVVVQGTGEVPTEGLYDCVLNWDMQIKLGDVDFVFKPGSDRTRFLGEDGWIQVARNPKNTMASDPDLLKTELDPSAHHLMVSPHHMGNFIEAVAKEDPEATVTTVEESVRSDIISHLCDIAVRTGETITWDPAKMDLVEASDESRAMLSRPMRGPWTL
jgi:predicted dehydrogenase